MRDLDQRFDVPRERLACLIDFIFRPFFVDLQVSLHADNSAVGRMCVKAVVRPPTCITVARPDRLRVKGGCIDPIVYLRRGGGGHPSSLDGGVLEC
jgi:hypothetical protein